MSRRKNQKTKFSQKKLLQNTTISLASYIFRIHILILLSPFFIHFVVVNFCQLHEQGKINIVSMFHFLDTDIREQKNYEIKTKTYVDNTVNDLDRETKFENCVKDKNNFFIKRNIACLSWTKIHFILGDIFLEIPKNLITSAFFWPRQILINRYASAKASNAALVKLTKWIIKNDHVINSCDVFL